MIGSRVPTLTLFLPWVHSWTLQTRMSHFVSTKDIWKYANFLKMIPSVRERRHIDALKIQSRKSKFRFREVLETSVLAIGPYLNTSTGMSHFATIKDILKYTNLLMTIPSLGAR